jgi:hypothetical protein
VASDAGAGDRAADRLALLRGIGVFATNLDSAEGTAVGVRQAGKANQVKIVNFDTGFIRRC